MRSTGLTVGWTLARAGVGCDWNVPGDCSPEDHPGGYRTMGGSIVTSRKAPMLGIQTPGERARMHRQHAKTCGHPMKIAGSPCARTPGHTEFAGGSHMTADAMAVRAERMRKP